jgi:hypothetical protein
MRDADPEGGDGMIRRLCIAASALSLLLGAATVLLWVRSLSKVDAWEVLTRGHVAWQFSSNPREWTLVHVAGWPEPAGTRHTSYARDDPRDLEEHSLAVLTALAPGAFVRKARFLGVSLEHGRVSTLVGRDGRLIRIPPSPPGTLLQYISAPMPYWSVSFPDWLLPAVFLLLPCGVLLRHAQIWIRRRARRGRTRCECCGYDLRASTDRCPECGMPAPSGRDAGRPNSDGREP